MEDDVSIDVVLERINNLDKKVEQLCGNVEAKVNADIMLKMMEQEKKITEATDAKFKSNIIAIISIFLFGITASVGTTAYFTTEANKTESITMNEINELNKTIIREVTKSNKAYLKASKTTSSRQEEEEVF